MIEYQGKYGKCKVMTYSIDPVAVSQLYDFLNCPASEGASIVIMPDVHAGAGCTIGLTSTTTDKVIPALVGVDIGCGVLGYRFQYHDRVNFEGLDEFIRRVIPCGFSVNEKKQDEFLDKDLLEEVKDVVKKTDQEESRVLRSLGSLGGGNHFIELGKVPSDVGGGYMLTVHSGSRHFGLSIANFYQKIARTKLGNRHGLEWLEGQDSLDYLNSMGTAQRYAEVNRELMCFRILDGFFGDSATNLEPILSVHNYIDFRTNMIRKGAISAVEGEQVIIPWNMRDGLVVGVGKGNADWNWSAPHGAGRSMGRKAAKAQFSVDDFKATMDKAGVWSSCIGKGTIDESPMAYKNHEDIQEALKDTVDIKYTVKPIYNFKAGEG